MGRKEYWDDEDYEEEPLVFVACNMVPAGTLMAAAMDKGDYPESDSEDEAYGANMEWPRRRSPSPSMSTQSS